MPGMEAAISAPWWSSELLKFAKRQFTCEQIQVMTRSRWIRTGFFVALGVLVVVATLAAILVHRFQPAARNYFISALRQHYKSDVSLGNLSISLFPQVRATGDDLIFRLPGHPTEPPLVIVRRFTFDADLVGFFRKPRRIRKLTLEGLEIHIPPKSGTPHGSSGGNNPPVPFILEEVVADGATLQTLPSDPRKAPLIFDIRKLTLHDVGKYRAMTFQAAIDNAKPPGLIHSTGDFGPWNSDEPGDTPVSGKYTFRDANLSVFHGIAGTLASDGQYHGALDRIDVEGTTDVPDFSLTTAGHPMHLQTEFAATVDGTNGNTDLHPVRATLGKSTFEVSGSIDRGALEAHKEIDLHASAGKTGLEDLLRLAVKSSRPPMTGRIRFDTSVKIPPGKTPVIERLQLDGTFNLNGVRFTSPEVEEKVASLSHHAQGDPKVTGTEGITAEFTGRFGLHDGVMGLPQLRFEVPGADVTLEGKYWLTSGDIDFTGTARLDATASQMVTGWKHVLLKPFDPLFRRDGAGAVLPIRITGTRGTPSFKLDIGRVLKRD
jgi:hypothetical protein